MNKASLLVEALLLLGNVGITQNRPVNNQAVAEFQTKGYQYTHVFYDRNDTCSSKGGFLIYSDILHYRDIMIDQQFGIFGESTIDFDTGEEVHTQKDSIVKYRITDMSSEDGYTIEIDKLKEGYRVLKQGTYFEVTGNGKVNVNWKDGENAQKPLPDNQPDTFLFGRSYLFERSFQKYNDKIDSVWVYALMLPHGKLYTMYNAVGWPLFDHFTLAGYFAVENSYKSSFGNCIIDFKVLNEEQSTQVQSLYVTLKEHIKQLMLKEDD